MNEKPLQKYSNSFIQDLAGNAFETSSCAANFLCGMVFMAENFKCQQATAGQVERPIGSAGNREIDDEEDEWGRIGELMERRS